MLKKRCVFVGWLVSHWKPHLRCLRLTLWDGSGPPFTRRIQKPQDEWLKTALAIVNSESWRKNRTYSQGFKKPEVNFAKSQNISNDDRKKKKDWPKKRVPKYPCKICEAMGIQAMHWHNECQNRQENQISGESSQMTVAEAGNSGSQA